ncbi:PadR family transcriptional regulator [Microbacterium kyungheense]|jgi:DNA-binding PadR family transcriptional regulator|uniref:DNA-binding PadR family transcriptional regulator n=1 Tax=Microbacterium kyungheense TaxID=1263636 RepID=A0A543FL41_9MICO|nr:PadR family transcriptional regulator [Microbacterium kyungheense]TQM34555.1 DNA-binding PadR family transcriptional regulator [Microbacterium kyungheense]
MSVRQSLLAILDQGPCYGYQLRAEFDRRTGSTWPLNVGQIYNTLDRLERDGLVEKGDVDDQGHVYWQITDAGAAEVRSWLDSPVERGQGTRDELAIKLAVAATLPGVEVADIIQTQRRASLAQLQELNRAKYAGENPDGPEELAWSLVVDSMIFAAEAEVRWLDHSEQRLAMHPDHAMALALSTEKPRRGRPALRQAQGPVAGPVEAPGSLR